MMPISLPFHWVTLAIKQTTGQPSISFVIEDHRRKIPKNGYLCMLIDSEVYSIVTYYFWKTNSMAIVTTGACAVVTKTTISTLCNCYIFPILKIYGKLIKFRSILAFKVLEHSTCLPLKMQHNE